MMALSDDAITNTGFKSIMINWNPCGHAPTENFGIGHFDVHVYRVDDPSSKYTCGSYPDNPVCFSTDPNAAKFFIPYKNNMPSLLVNGTYQPVLMDSVGVANMGMHWWVPTTVSATNWVIPTIVTGSYNGKFIFSEQMFPVKTFTDGISISQEVTYADQTKYDLPRYYEVYANSNTMSVVCSLRGQIKVTCSSFMSQSTCQNAWACSWNGGKCKDLDK